MHPRMQNASLLPVPELTPAADYIPLSPPSYEVAEEYAMGMLSALQGTAALGAGLHIAGSLLIVFGQTLVKVNRGVDILSKGVDIPIDKSCSCFVILPWFSQSQIMQQLCEQVRSKVFNGLFSIIVCCVVTTSAGGDRWLSSWRRHQRLADVGSFRQDCPPVKHISGDHRELCFTFNAWSQFT